MGTNKSTQPVTIRLRNETVEWIDDLMGFYPDDNRHAFLRRMIEENVQAMQESEEE